MQSEDGYIVAANNQATTNSRPVPGTVRSHHLNMKLGSMVGMDDDDVRSKIEYEDMERLILSDVTDDFARTIIQQIRLTSIFRQQMGFFGEYDQEKIQILTNVLQGWEGQFRPDSIEATVFTLYYHNAARALFHQLDEKLIVRLVDTEEFHDGFIKIIEAVVKMPSKNTYN